jgi:hypothetical protein
MHKILICGGRNFNDFKFMLESVDKILTEKYEQNWPTKVSFIHGGAKGADSLAGLLAEGLSISCQVFMADWNQYGKQAGYIRNKQMLDEGKPDLIIAFPGGAGTNMMCNISTKANVEVIRL